MSDPVAEIDIRKAEGEDYAYALYDENGNEVDRFFMTMQASLSRKKQARLSWMSRPLRMR